MKTKKAIKTMTQTTLLLLATASLLCITGQAYGQQKQSAELHLYFKIGNLSIDPNYQDNAITLYHLSEIITPESAVHIDSLIVSGYSSPDGASTINNRLAEERAKSVQRYLTTRYPYLQPGRITASGKGVNWNRLRELVEADKSTPNREKILSIIDNVPAEINYRTATSRKKSLMNLGTTTWNYMLRNQFPLLRTGASMVITLVPQTPDAPLSRIDSIAQPLPKNEPEHMEQLIPPIEEAPPTPPAATPNARTYRVALKTNLLYGAYTFTPNLGVEIGLGRRTTLNITGGYNWFNLNGTESNNKKRVHWLVQPEFRYFLNESFNGHFFGVHALYSHYNIGEHNLPLLFGKGSEQYRHEGWAAGAGVSYGYELRLGRSWNVEFNVGVGYARLGYDKYNCTYCAQQTGSETRHYFGPTKAAVALIWMINRDK